MARKDEIIVGLDVGTHKVSAVVGEVKPDGSVEVIGLASCHCAGLRKGMVSSVAEATEAIQKAVHEAELMATCTVNAVYVNVSGAHLKSFNNRGVVAVQNKEVSSLDVEKVLENAQAVQIPADRQIIHTVPQEYVVDDGEGTDKPEGICGVRLQVNVHIVTALRAGVQNVTQCAERAGLHVLKTSAESLASARAVLTKDERDLGVALVDIGAGTTDIAIFHNGFVVHTAVLAMGGEFITNDIAVGLRTPRAEAERIKLQHGCALSQMVEEDETIDVPVVGGREPIVRKRRLLCDIIEPRMEEIFRFIEREIQASNFADVLGSGVVLTGGCALLPGAAELGEDVLGLPVRVGQPVPVAGLNDLVHSPSYSTALGLVLQAADESGQGSATDRSSRSGKAGWLRSLSDWFSKAYN
jgi:cell division protein FtsA